MGKFWNTVKDKGSVKRMSTGYLKHHLYCSTAKPHLEHLCDPISSQKRFMKLCNQLQVAALQISRAETDLRLVATSTAFLLE